MKHRAACLVLALLLNPAQAEDALPAGTAPAGGAAQLLPLHRGYAFDQPEILIRQRLFGLAHGLSMLAAACLDLPEHSAPIQDAYAAWHARQAGAIRALVLDLAAYYFGARADEAGWPDLARALNLKDSIQPSLGAVSLPDACASLPAAIQHPRYQLAGLLAEAAAPAAGNAATVAVPLAPTPEPAPSTTTQDSKQ